MISIPTNAEETLQRVRDLSEHRLKQSISQLAIQLDNESTACVAIASRKSESNFISLKVHHEAEAAWRKATSQKLETILMESEKNERH